MLVNACYWALGMEERIPAESKVDIVGTFEPTPFGNNRYKKGVKPGDLRMTSGELATASTGADKAAAPTLAVPAAAPVAFAAEPMAHGGEAVGVDASPCPPAGASAASTACRPAQRPACHCEPAPRRIRWFSGRRGR
jgi:hypothetical protein